MLDDDVQTDPLVSLRYADIELVFTPAQDRRGHVESDINTGSIRVHPGFSDQTAPVEKQPQLIGFRQIEHL